jgi:hypothetical protein
MPKSFWILMLTLDILLSKSSVSCVVPRNLTTVDVYDAGKEQWPFEFLDAWSDKDQ